MKINRNRSFALLRTGSEWNELSRKLETWIPAFAGMTKQWFYFFLNHLTSEAIPFLLHMADDEVLNGERFTIRDRSISIRECEGEIHTLHSSS